MKTATDETELSYEKIKFLSEELNKNYIPTYQVKEEFFARFIPEITEDIKQYYVIISTENKTEGFKPGWLLFDDNLEKDKIIAYKPEEILFTPFIPKGI